jgi:hypothetical protein
MNLAARTIDTGRRVCGVYVSSVKRRDTGHVGLLDRLDVSNSVCNGESASENNILFLFGVIVGQKSSN